MLCNIGLWPAKTSLKVKLPEFRHLEGCQLESVISKLHSIRILQPVVFILSNAKVHHDVFGEVLSWRSAGAFLDDVAENVVHRKIGEFALLSNVGVGQGITQGRTSPIPIIQEVFETFLRREAFVQQEERGDQSGRHGEHFFDRDSLAKGDRFVVGDVVPSAAVVREDFPERLVHGQKFVVHHDSHQQGRPALGGGPDLKRSVGIDVLSNVLGGHGPAFQYDGRANEGVVGCNVNYGPCAGRRGHGGGVLGQILR
mmetsp:Transcript_34012/g.72501  ORF Transcript_34012/g.72501 Transcript_34012/m.72501 type:complete len:255 (-) Transcript_34012:10-774(-)